MLQLICIIFIAQVLGDYGTENAPAKEFHKGFAFDTVNGVDADGHPVFSMELSSGEFVSVGNCVDKNGVWGPKSCDMCAIKYSSSGNKVWQRRYGVQNQDDGLNFAIESPDSSYILLVGYKNLHRTMLKVDPSNGDLIHTFTWTDNTNSAFEYGTNQAGTGKLVLSGLRNGENEGYRWTFKSAGNVDAGQGLVQIMNWADIDNNLSTTTALTYFSHTWSFKSITELTDGSFVAIGSDEFNQRATKIDASGNEVWTKAYQAVGEFTGVTFTADGGFATIGHCSYAGLTGDSGCSDSDSEFTGIDGVIHKYTTDGEEVWSKRYKTPNTGLSENDQKVVYEECWSIVTTSDGGLVGGCGSGTHCDDIPNSWVSVCQSANLESWRSFIFKANGGDGSTVWMRSDEEKATNLNYGGNACEFVTVRANGGYVSTNDETEGFGLSVYDTDGTSNGSDDSNPTDGGSDGSGDDNQTCSQYTKKNRCKEANCRWMKSTKTCINQSTCAKITTKSECKAEKYCKWKKNKNKCKDKN